MVYIYVCIPIAHCINLDGFLLEAGMGVRGSIK